MNIKDTTKQKIIACVLAGVVAAVVACPVAYMTVRVAGAHHRPPKKEYKEEHPDFMKNHMETLVQEGKVTQEQASKLENSFKAFHQKQKEEREAWVKQLPTETGISEDTLKETMQPPHHPMGPEHRDAPQQEAKDT